MGNYKWYAVFFTLILPGVFIASFNGLYGQDSYEYLRYTQSLVAFVKNGTSPGSFFWPLLYPVTGSIFSLILPAPFALQLISLLAFILTAIYLEKCLKLLYGASQNIVMKFIFLFFLLSPYMLRASIVVMSDSLCTFFIVAAFYYFLLYRKSLSQKYFVLHLILCFLAFTTRYAALVVLLPVTVHSLYLFFKNFRIGTLIISVAAVMIISTPFIVLRGNSAFGFIHNQWLETWSPLNLIRNHFNTKDLNSSYTFPNIIYVFFNLIHPAFCFAGIIFTPLIFFKRKAVNRPGPLLILVISVALYAIFLAGIPFQNLRFLQLTFPFVLLLFFPAFAKLNRILSERKTHAYLVSTAIAIQLVLIARAVLPFYADNRLEKEIAYKMLNYNNKVLYTFSIDGALKAYGYSSTIVNMGTARFDTLQNFNTNAYILFNTQEFGDEYKNRDPMLNWAFLNRKYDLKPIINMPSHWVLYSLSSR